MPSHGSEFVSHPSLVSVLAILSDKMLLDCSPQKKRKKKNAIFFKMQHRNIGQAKKLFSIFKGRCPTVK